MVDYHFEEVQHFSVAVYDVDDKKHVDDLSRHDFIGEAQFRLSDVVTAGKVLTKRLTSSSEYLPAFEACTILRRVRHL